MKQDAGWWIGWIEEVPGVNCQEASREALLETLRTTLAEALQDKTCDQGPIALPTQLMISVRS